MSWYTKFIIRIQQSDLQDIEATLKIARKHGKYATLTKLFLFYFKSNDQWIADLEKQKIEKTTLIKKLQQIEHGMVLK